MLNGFLLGGAIGALLVTCVAFRACFRADNEHEVINAFSIGGSSLVLAAGLGFSAFALMELAPYWTVLCALLFLTLTLWACFKAWKKEIK